MHIRNRWEGNCYFSLAPQSNARGVAILFSKKVDGKIHKHKHDAEGNFLILDMTVCDKRLSLVNIYGQIKMTQVFMKMFLSVLQKWKMTNT